MSEFRNKNVLITGAASGIGKLLAEQIAAYGAHVILWDVNEIDLLNLRDVLQQQGLKATAFICNVAQAGAVRRTAAYTRKRCGPIDILINNAGIVSGKSLQDASEADIRRTFGVNTFAMFWTTRAFLEDMLERGGHIVNVASAAGLIGTPRLVDYSASKFAAVGFDEALRMELRRLEAPVKTTLVCPYYIDTGMFAGVRSRFSFLLPILKPEYVVERIINAIQKDKPRLIMPRFVYLLYPARLLPVRLFDWIVRLLGINRSMDHFHGRH